MWPAFWIIGGNLAAAGWPQCGEADIMESLGRTPSVNAATLHGPGYSGHLCISANYTLPGGAVFSTDFHVFAAEWELNVIRFYVDDNLYATRTPADVGTNKWVYDHPFYIILNLAVGGRLPGNPDASTIFPASMLVDYVRVYSR
jgi:beta-glucanase (GH16 family)